MFSRENKKTIMFFLLLGLIAGVTSCNFSLLGEGGDLVRPVEKSFSSLNLASEGIILTPASLEEYPPEYAIDGDPETYWQPGEAVQWIEIDLGVSVDIEKIRLVMHLETPGMIQVKVHGKGPWDDDEYQFLHQFQEQTENGRVLEVENTKKWLGIQYVKVEIIGGAVPFGLSEIEVLSPKLDPSHEPYLDSDNDGVIDRQDWCPNTSGKFESNGC